MIVKVVWDTQASSLGCLQSAMLTPTTGDGAVFSLPTFDGPCPEPLPKCPLPTPAERKAYKAQKQQQKKELRNEAHERTKEVWLVLLRTWQHLNSVGRHPQAARACGGTLSWCWGTVCQAAAERVRGGNPGGCSNSWWIPAILFL